MEQKYKLIRPTSDIYELEDMRKAWERQPYELRLKSDEECLKLYGFTNTDLYRNIRAAILQETIPDMSKLGKSMIESTIINTDNNIGDNTDEKSLELYKIDLAKRIESQNPNIVLIYPKGFTNKNTIDDLNDRYHHYSKLPDKYKRLSNSISNKLWGHGVLAIYHDEKGHLSSDKFEADLYHQDPLAESQNFLSLLEDSVNDMILDNDILGLYKIKLEACDPKIGGYCKGIYESIVSDIDHYMDQPEDFEELLPRVVPCYTSDEIDTFPDDVNRDNYYNTIYNYITDYKNNPCKETEQQLLKYGWNPTIPFNEKGFAYARKRQVQWLKENAIKIIDLTKLNNDSFIQESSSHMRNLYKKYGIYPIYIVASFSNTIFGNVIRTVKHSTYTHAGLSLDSDLKQILTYKFDTNYNGFHNENLDTYLGKSKNAKICVMALFVDDKTKNRIKNIIQDFYKNQKKTRYGFGNVLNIFFGKEKDYSDSLALVCSQFVDMVFRLANIQLFDKPNNLVIPQDYVTLSRSPKVFKVFEGYVKDYKEKDVEKKIENLFYLYNASDLEYSNVMDLMVETYEAKQILSEMKNLLKPEAVLYEIKIPIQFNKKGDLEIIKPKSLEQEYQEAHKLLKEYGDKNTTGIKHELARLFYVNNVIEKKLQKMKKDDPDYKSFINLRARVLNDFKKYFKIVSDKEKDFDFNQYYQSSEYNEGNYMIKHSTLKHSGNLISKFINPFKK